jgi:hypothetical protein
MFPIVQKTLSKSHPLFVGLLVESSKYLRVLLKSFAEKVGYHYAIPEKVSFTGFLINTIVIVTRPFTE